MALHTPLKQSCTHYYLQEEKRGSEGWGGKCEVRVKDLISMSKRLLAPAMLFLYLLSYEAFRAEPDRYISLPILSANTEKSQINPKWCLSAFPTESEFTCGGGCSGGLGDVVAVDM